MPFEINLNETPLEGTATCGTCGRAAGGERKCSACVLRGGGADVARNGPGMCLGTEILGRTGLPPIADANFLQLGRGLSLSRASQKAIQIPYFVGENFDPQLKRGILPPNSTDLNLALRSQSEMYLRSLREYINQRGGFLNEGWSVDFFYCQNSCETSAVYCSPERKRFDTMVDVARHLEFKRRQSLEAESRNDVSASLQSRLHTPQIRKKSSKFSRGNSSRENQNGGSAFFQDLFPLQFADFFILSLGMIDSRPSYHNINQIWPVGYKSCWHDQISGSVFVSEVLEGGDAGPIFRIRRFSCSAFPIPVGSTVLSRRNPSPCNGKEKVSNICSTSNGINNGTIDDNDGDDEFLSIQMMLNEDTPPNLGEIDFRKESSSSTESEEIGDSIGEFSVESRSSFLAWEMASRSLIHACHMAYKQKGKLRFRCKHDVDREDAKTVIIKDRLSRFCYRSGPIDNIPQVVGNNTEFVVSGKILIKWLQQDRFGLDVEFVQELFEQLPAVRACSGYIFLNKRDQYSGMLTVQSGFLLSKRKSNAPDAQEPDGISLTVKSPRRILEDSAPIESYPLGKPFSKLPPCLVGDVLQGWEFLWRFSEILGLEEPFSLLELENELIHPWVGTINPGEGAGNERQNWDITSCTGLALRKAHSSLLKAIGSGLVLRVAAYVDPNSDDGESKSRRGEKKESESSPVNEIKFDMLQINELTWPELARRFILVVLLLEGNLESAEINSSLGSKISHCLQGDGGILCGSLTGVAGMEADALLLAQAQKLVFGPPKNNEIFSVDQPKPEAISTPMVIEIDDDDVPEWAQALEPVRKLPTNVGARLKKCVHHALELNPPEWAKKILHHSISREVYKGNASGPTKRAVVSLLAEVCGKGFQPKPVKRERSSRVWTISDLLMKQCRIVLRRAAAEDNKKIFCYLLGKTYDSEEEGLLGSPGMVSRPLDFRVIDFRLAAGAYAGSHEAFFEDVCEMLNNIRSIYADRSNIVKRVEKVSQKFKDMYEGEILLLVQKLSGNSNSLSITDEAKRETNAQLLKLMERSIPKAPWEDGICKVCGVDKDDDNVLLCDSCDSEYHSYCLNPPLATIPDGNWYCPSCAARRRKSRGPPCDTQVVGYKKKNIRGEITRQLLDKLSQLAQSMGSKEYWKLSVEERTFLFKFLCDETLNTSTLRDHVDHCASMSTELQQKLCFLSAEWKNLKTREENLGSIIRKTDADGSAQGHSGNNSVGQQLEDGSFNESNNCFGQPQGSSSRSKSIPEIVSDTTDDQNSVNKSKTVMAENNYGDSSTSQASGNDVTSLKLELSTIQESISSLESELEKMSVRKEFLGRDSAGRVYWGFGRPGTCSLLVDRSLENPSEENLNFGESSQLGMVFPEANRGWFSYQSDGEISEIVERLGSGEASEMELRESILRWQKCKTKGENLSPDEKSPTCSKLPETSRPAISDFRVTKAAAILEKKYGPCLGLDKGETSTRHGQKGNLSIEGKMYRCDCLELIWHLKHHCFLCHKTLPTNEELLRHYDGNCLSRAEEESRKGKIIVSEPSPNNRPDCPHDVKDISSKIVMQKSLTELVRDIERIGSSSHLSIAPRSLGFVDQMALRSVSQGKFKSGNKSKDSNSFPRSFPNDRGEGTSKDGFPKNRRERDDFRIRRHRGSTRGDNRCEIPDMSLRRLSSRESAILSQLKMNLLDMDAALPEEAVRPSMAQPERRSVWSSFVKSAGTIFEMVQATIVLENMIRADCLRREWWYWSSPTAAVNISTLSALALRLSTLEAAIVYEKPSPIPYLSEVSELNKDSEPNPPKPSKGKEKASPSKRSGSPKRKQKANKKRKESGSW